jgi:hypothetical protein
MSSDRPEQSLSNHQPFIQQTFSMGTPLIDLTKANALAQALDGAEREVLNVELDSVMPGAPQTEKMAQPTK